VNKKYVQVDEDRATRDLARDLPFGGRILSLTREFNSCRTLEAKISRDADQLELILSLKEQQDLGNSYAGEWLTYALKRLCTHNGREMAEEILQTDSTEWWFEKKTELWVNGPANDRDLEK
jgi:putative hydrolase of HD superfamily